MCEICNQMPCHPRCPNAPEPKIIEVCVVCGQEIREGEEYFEMEGQSYCTDCLTKTFPDDDEDKTICDICGEEIDYNSWCYSDGKHKYCSNCVSEKIAENSYF